MRFRNKKTGEIREFNPVCINSAKLSAQQRKRLFWCNWKVEQPEDRGIYLRDVLEYGALTEREKSYCIDTNYHKGAHLDFYFKKGKRQLVFQTPHRIGEIGKGGQGDRIYSINGKSVCLSANGGGRGAKTGLYLTPCGESVNYDKEKLNISLPGWSKAELKEAVDKGILNVRKLIPTEVEALQGFPRGYTEGVSDTRRFAGLGNAFCVPVIEHIIKSLDMLYEN